MLRQSWILATTSANKPPPDSGVDRFVLAVPVVHLWNPYNVKISMDPSSFSTFGSLFWSVAIRQIVYNGGVLVDETDFPDYYDGRDDPNHGVDGRQFGYRMIPAEGGASSPIEFEPGEVRVFSTDVDYDRAHGDAHSDRSFFATPGYTPISDTGNLRGLKYRVDPGDGPGVPSIALRVSQFKFRNNRHNDNIYFGAPEHASLIFNFQEASTANQGAYYENGGLVTKEGEWHPVSRLSAISLNWIKSSELGNAWVIPNTNSGRASWGTVGSTPLPIGIFSVVAKSAERLDFDDSSSDYARDFRNRTWLHAPPTGMGCYVIQPEDLSRADSPYQVYFSPVNSDAEVAQHLQAIGRNGYFGASYTPDGQTHVAPLSLPTAPAMSLGAFAGVKVESARAHVVQADDNGSNPAVPKPNSDNAWLMLKHRAHRGGAFGVGPGNAYAHPMVGPDEVYANHDLGTDPGEWRSGNHSTRMAICNDYWDHLFLANEELWDSWFCSGIVPEMAGGSESQSGKSVARRFFSGEPTLMPQAYRPYPCPYRS